jgi:hypothetical protein
MVLEAQQSDSIEEDSHRLPDPLRIAFTSSLPDILYPPGISLAISPYRTGKVILIREDVRINSYFRSFQKPMGIAAANGRLTTGGANTVRTCGHMPAEAHKSEPSGKHDTCCLPPTIHATGNVDIHEMAYQAGNLQIQRVSYHLTGNKSLYKTGALDEPV